MWNWLNASNEKAFGEELAKFYMERVAVDQAVATRKAREKYVDVVAKLTERITRYRASARLNIYKKAQLWNTFKWRLRDAGYDEREIEALVRDLVIYL